MDMSVRSSYHHIERSADPARDTLCNRARVRDSSDPVMSPTSSPNLAAPLEINRL